MKPSSAVEEEHEGGSCRETYQGINDRLSSYFGDFGECPGARVQAGIIRLGVGSAADPLLVAAGHVSHLGRHQKEGGHRETDDCYRQKNIADSEVHLRVTKGDRFRPGARGEDITSWSKQFVEMTVASRFIERLLRWRATNCLRRTN